MNTALIKAIEDLKHMTVGELQRRYAEALGEETRARNKDFLRKRIAWRLQAKAEGGLSERARRRVLEIADDADLRLRAPRDPQHNLAANAENGRSVRSRIETKRRRLPLPGAVLVREWRGLSIVVKVLDDGFEYEGRHFRSLSAVACEVTGTKWNGFTFFNID